jgi:hypothetical protein
MIVGLRVFRASVDGKSGQRQEEVNDCKSSEALTLDWDDQLRDDRENFGAAIDQHVLRALLREKCVWLLNLSQPVKENGQVVVEVQLSKAAEV